MNITHWIKRHLNLTLFLGTALVIGVIYWLGMQRPISDLATTWYWIMLVMVAFVLMLSYFVTGDLFFGWMINEQNRMSLSRFQAFLWTIVILSAYVTAVFANLRFGFTQEGLAIAIPRDLWLAMGISVTALVGSGLILEEKKKKLPQQPEMMAMEPRDGVLNVEEKPSLLNLITGEELANRDKIDLTRLQSLLFTFILVGVYMASLSAMFSELVTVTPDVQDIAQNFPITSFPELGSSAIALLGISQAGYLVAKAVDKQPSQSLTS